MYFKYTRTIGMRKGVVGKKRIPELKGKLRESEREGNWLGETCLWMEKEIKGRRSGEGSTGQGDG